MKNDNIGGEFLSLKDFVVVVVAFVVVVVVVFYEAKKNMKTF